MRHQSSIDQRHQARPAAALDMPAQNLMHAAEARFRETSGV
jgi:hypothetical protein